MNPCRLRERQMPYLAKTAYSFIYKAVKKAHTTLATLYAGKLTPDLHLHVKSKAIHFYLQHAMILLEFLESQLSHATQKCLQTYWQSRDFLQKAMENLEVGFSRKCMLQQMLLDVQPN